MIGFPPFIVLLQPCPTSGHRIQKSRTLDKERNFELFFKENYSRFYYFAYQMISEREVCHDIVSDSFEQTWNAIRPDKAEKEINWNSYMYSLIRNKCVDYIRYEMAKERYAD